MKNGNPTLLNRNALFFARKCRIHELKVTRRKNLGGFENLAPLNFLPFFVDLCEGNRHFVNMAWMFMKFGTRIY